MKTIYISIYKERHRKFGNGSIPPETAGESGRQSSTVRGKQDRNPALLLGYTFVYETIQEMQHEVACHAQLHDSSVAQLVRAPH